MAATIFFPPPPIAPLHNVPVNAETEDEETVVATQTTNVPERTNVREERTVALAAPIDIAALLGRERRVTLKPRRTLSLSPTPG